jgi:LPS O-antigen subunit length determinant protein (WzzB/FepE family)
MDTESIKFAITLAQFVMLIALAAYTYLGDQTKATSARVTALETDLTDKYEEHGERLSRLEVSVDGQLTHKDLADLYESVNKLAATVNQLVGETKLQSDCLRMMINQMVNRRAGDPQP